MRRADDQQIRVEPIGDPVQAAPGRRVGGGDGPGLHADLGELRLQQRVRLLAGQRFDIDAQAAHRERLVWVDMHGDNLRAGDIAEAACQRERVATSLQTIDSDDDRSEHDLRPPPRSTPPSLGRSRRGAIRVDRASSCGRPAIARAQAVPP